MSLRREPNKFTGLKWTVFCVLFFVVLQVALHPAVLKVPVLYAEDGGVFVNDYLKNGMTSFLTTSGGYLVTISRLAAFLGVTMGRLTSSFSAVGNTVEIFSMLIVAVVCAYFASESFSWISKKKYVRMLNGIALLLLISCFHMMLYNSVDLHWWCGIFALLAGMNIARGDKIRPVWLAMLTLCILSTPSAFVVVLPVLYRISSKQRRKDMVGYIITLLCLALQAAAVVLLSGSGKGGFISAWGLLRTMRYIVELTLGAPLFIFGPQVFRFAMTNGLGVILGGVSWVALYYTLKKCRLRHVFVLSVANIVLMYFMVLFKRQYKLDSEYMTLTDTWYTIFYNVLPAAICFVLFVMVFWMYVVPHLRKLLGKNRPERVINMRALATIPIILITSYYFNTYSDNKVLDLAENEDYEIVEEYIDYSAPQYALINILPYDDERWQVYIPVKESYCVEHKCYGDIEVEIAP